MIWIFFKNGTRLRPKQRCTEKERFSMINLIVTICQLFYLAFCDLFFLFSILGTDWGTLSPVYTFRCAISSANGQIIFWVNHPAGQRKSNVLIQNN